MEEGGSDTLRKAEMLASCISQSSIISEAAVMRTPWLCSASNGRTFGTKFSMSSGTLRTIRIAHSAA